MIKINLKPSKTQLRQFGWASLFGFPGVAVMLLWTHQDWEVDAVSWTLFGLGVVCAVLAATVAEALRPLYVVLMIVAFPIGMVLSAVLLRVIYYLVFTPMALWFKVIGRDAMHRKLEPDADTYWCDHRDRTKPRSPSSYLRLY